LLPRFGRFVTEPFVFDAPKDLAGSRTLVLRLARMTARGEIDIDSFSAIVSALRTSDDLYKVDLMSRLQEVSNRLDEKLDRGEGLAAARRGSASRDEAATQ
jgi:hypothetical protein